MSYKELNKMNNLSIRFLVCMICLLVLFANCKQFSTSTNESAKYPELYVVRVDGKYGYIDKNGNIKIEPKYMLATFFYQNRAICFLDSHLVLIDTTGNIIKHPNTVSLLGPLWNGYARIEGANYKQGFMDANGNVVIPCLYDEVGYFGPNGLAPFKQNGKMGFLNKEGQIVVKAILDDDLGINRKDFPFTIGMETGMFHLEGEFYFFPQPLTYYRGVFFNDGLAKVGLNGQYGFIDSLGNFIIQPQFKEKQISEFSEGLASIQYGDYPDKKEGYIDKTGKIVINPTYYVARNFKDGRACVYNLQPSESYIIDTKGQELHHIPNAIADPFYEGLSVIHTGGDNYGYINTQGEIVIKPQFERAEAFHNGMARVRLNEKWGYINKSGEFVIKPQFDDASDFINDRALVFYGGSSFDFFMNKIPNAEIKRLDVKMGYINTNGQFVWNPTN